MKTLLLAAAMALGLAAAAADAGPVVHGIPSPKTHCWPGRWNHWCHHRPLGRVVVGHTVGLNTGVHGLVIKHPIGVPAHTGATTVPTHGVLVNGIPAEQRVQH